MTRAFFISSLFLILTSAGLFANQLVNHKWGEYIERVKENQSGILFSQSEDFLKYKTKFFGYTSIVEYNFSSLQLISTSIKPVTQSSTGIEVISEFLAITDSIKKDLKTEGQKDSEFFGLLYKDPKEAYSQFIDEPDKGKILWELEDAIHEFRIVRGGKNLKLVLDSYAKDLEIKDKSFFVTEVPDLIEPEDEEVIQVKSDLRVKMQGNNISKASSRFQVIPLTDKEGRLKQFSYKIKEVQDRRAYRNSIGFVQKGMTNVPVEVKLNNPLEIEIRSFLNSTFDTAGSPGVTLIIKEFKITEKSDLESETGFCKLGINYIIPVDSGYFSVIETEVMTTLKGLEVTKKHSENITSALEKSFYKLTQVDLSKYDEFKFVPNRKGEFVNLDAEIMQKPIFTEQIKNGIYPTYKDLRENQPDSTIKFIVRKVQRSTREWTGTFRLVPRLESSGKLIKDIYAFCYDDTVYISHAKDFFPLVIEKYSLRFVGSSLANYASTQGAYLAGGVIGAGIAAGAEKSKAKSQKITYFIDPMSGKYGP